MHKFSSNLKTKLLSIPLLTGLALFTSQGHAESIWDQYWTTASQLNANIETSSFENLATETAKLTSLATKILPDFIVKQPVCTEYLNEAIKAAVSMQSMSLEEIEAYYHADGKLPAMKDASCYHAKDLLVHPATMSVIVKTLPDSKENREKLHHELEEVLEHFNQVKSVAL